MRRRSPDYSPSKLTKTSLVLAGVGGLLLSSCSSSPAPLPEAVVVDIMPADMVGFLQPGSTTDCYMGGARPCAILIRTEPNRSSPYINATPKQGTVKWPRETYRDFQGDPIAIECYEAGENVVPYEGSVSSSDWYRVVVPLNHVLNKEVSDSINKPNSLVQAVQYEGQEAVIGYAALAWFNQSAPSLNVPVC